MTSFQPRPPYDPTRPPTVDEIGIDRMKLVQGFTAQCDSREAFTDLFPFWAGNFRPFDRDLLSVKRGFRFPERDIEVTGGFLVTGLGGVGRYRHPDTLPTGRAEGALDLWINPTRFAAHQPSPIDLDTLAAMDAISALRLMPDVAADAASACLAADSDNVLVGGRWGGGAAWWDGLLHILLGHVRTALGEVLVPPPGEVPGAEVTLAPLKLKELELYHEQETPPMRSARAEVASLYDRLRIAAFEVDAVHGFVRLKGHRSGHALALKVPITGEITLCIYAKAEHIVRFEMRYCGTMHKLAGLPKHAGVHDIVTALRTDAVNRFTKIAQELSAVLHDDPPNRADLGELLAEICIASAGDPDSAQRLIASFVTEGAVAQVKGAPLVPLRVLQHLERRGVLRPIRLRHGHVHWALTPRFAAAVGQQVNRLPDVRRLRELHASRH